MSVLKQKISWRKGMRASIEALRKRIDELVKYFTDENLIEIMDLRTTVNEQVRQLKELDEEISDVIQPEDVEADTMEAM